MMTLSTPQATAMRTPRDPFAGYVSLLLNFDQQEGSTKFFDRSRYRNEVTTSANAIASTTQRRLGATSLYLDGTDDILSIEDAQQFAFGFKDFTVEAWVYPISGGSGLRSVFSKATAYSPLLLAHNGGSWLIYMSSAGTSWDITAATNLGSLTLNAWSHLAVCRTGSTIRGYLNGTLGATITHTGTLWNNSVAVRIGSNAGGSNLPVEFFPGYIDEVRITIGASRYAGPFTAPTTRFPLP